MCKSLHLNGGGGGGGGGGGRVDKWKWVKRVTIFLKNWHSPGPAIRLHIVTSKSVTIYI